MSSPQADAINSRAAEVADWLHSEIDIPGSPIEKNQELRDMLFRTIKDVSKEGYSKYYMPHVVSIGPIHRGRHHVRSMDYFKQKAVRKLAERVKDEVSVEQVYASVEQDLLRARDRNYNDRAWCLMMFLDGCFIIEFICNNRNWLNMKKHDRDLVRRDLLLYANQLPFVVLQVLARTFRCKEFTLDLLTIWFLQIPLLPKSSAPTPTFLDYIKSCFPQVSRRPHQQGVLFKDDVGEEEQAAAAAAEDDDLALCSPFSVTELKKVGISCSCARPRYRPFRISSYLCFMGMFINGEEDVKELRARGILQINFLNGDDQAVVNFFRHITAHYEPNPQACRKAR
ncbi:hypothetical protein K7X08_031219 [Anisodus acutangulus]|uniref:Uncharacterized protein n=1 Tax=Anisodus acutangulus TaxID=402998 RepID=A0A9Q1MKQ9_9SOLA|nr:hypothetical protein K7X08_031219 [Anisodus acutangulus]